MPTASAMSGNRILPGDVLPLLEDLFGMDLKHVRYLTLYVRMGEPVRLELDQYIGKPERSLSNAQQS